MSTTTDSNDDQNGRTEVEWPELQDGWEWQSGETSRSYYRHWFGTEYRQGGDLVHDGCIGGYDGEIIWDRGSRDGYHTVLIYPITGFRADGDPRISPYADIVRNYDTKQEAVNAVPELIEELKERYR